MTESEWLTCNDPYEMLTWLRGRASARKLRLFACGGCRLSWGSLPEGSRTAVETSERFADGEATWNELKTACYGIGMEVFEGIGMRNWCAQSARDASSKVEPERAWVRGLPSSRLPDREDQFSVYGSVVYSLSGYRETYRATHAALLRDLFGNPFRPTALDTTCKSPAVLSLAQSIYDHHAFDQLPALANALEEAGCRSGELLGHCRSPGRHIRGCWAVDLVLGKE